ncbi:MAG: arsenic resistance N-acetyltransferase ArsN2 [Burkholderiaceae bacterium]
MHVEPFLIEPKRSRDGPRIRELLQQANLIDDDLQAVDFLVMREAGQVVGAIGLQNADGAGLLRSLVVAPQLHRQGRGAALVAALEQLAARRGIDDMYLLTVDAAAFFALLDYLRVDRASVPAAVQLTSQFTSRCPSSAACMHKRLRK